MFPEMLNRKPVIKPPINADENQIN